MFWVFALLNSHVQKMKEIVTITMNAKVVLDVAKTIVMHHLDMTGVLTVVTNQLEHKFEPCV